MQAKHFPKMERAFTLKFLLIAVMVLVLYPKAETTPTWAPRSPLPPITPPPLCASQFALVNHACSVLPYTQTPPSPEPPTPPPESPSIPSHGGPDINRSHNHPPSHGGSDNSHYHHHNRHHQQLKHRNTYKETSLQEECCRWLKEVDNVCVCDILVHLPPFLTRPVHNYTVVVDESCEVTFLCGSRLVQL